MGYDQSVSYGHILKGELRAAMAYLAQFPEQSGLYQKYVSLFQAEHYLTYAVDASLNGILLAYQKYYRDVFYLEQDPEEAAQRLRGHLALLLGAGSGLSLDELEEGPVPEAFQKQGLHFLGGRTSGYYGPYIWRTEELEHYAVELPEGTQDYAVMFLDGFVSKSWLDYLTFGAAGTGGWSANGLIHCVRSGYDLGSESFLVSLLKHEAQHAMDQAKYGAMAPEDLEYRAKLVELIYSRERDMLSRFALEADRTKEANGHALASGRIVEGFQKRLGRADLASLPIEEAQSIARALFAESTRELEERYG